MLRRLFRDERGQTLVEWAVFMPCLVGLMFALIFFSRLGVLSERSQSAVRYGDMVSFRNGNPYSVATVESVIDEIMHSNQSELGPLCLEPYGTPPPATATVPPLLSNSVSPVTSTSLPVWTPAPTATSTSIATRVAADTQAALIQSQVPAGATESVASAKPYWRPDAIAGSNCNPASIALSSGAYGVGNLPVSVQTVSVSSSLNIPSYLSTYISNGETSAKMGFLNVATPNVLIACVPGLNLALQILQPSIAGLTGPICPSKPTGS